MTETPDSTTSDHDYDGFLKPSIPGVDTESSGSGSSVDLEDSTGNAGSFSEISGIVVGPGTIPGLALMDWNPLSPLTHEEAHPPPQCILRIKRDMMAIYNEPPPGILVVPDEQDLTLVHALITGTYDTPYEGGFFYFLLRFPPDYPIKPPKVKLMTTGGSKVRFNPNLYKCGKVCLSILGTWTGPCWSPAQTLSSVLISIQSLLTDKPYHNEPGFERERMPGDVARYNEIIQHETLRVAVVGMLDNDYAVVLPPQLREAMEKSFLQMFDFYESMAQSKTKLDGTFMQDPFGERRGQFDYKTILVRLRAIHCRLKPTVSPAESHSSSSTPESND